MLAMDSHYEEEEGLIMWYPIDTAPKDTAIDIWFDVSHWLVDDHPEPETGFRATDCFWRNGHWWTQHDEEVAPVMLGGVATHWMPKPPPPPPVSMDGMVDNSD